MSTLREAAQQALALMKSKGWEFDRCVIELETALAEPQPEPVTECADNDSPWLICKPCAAAGKCAKEPVGWAQRGMRNGETYLRMIYNCTPYPPPADVVRNLNLVPVYVAPQPQRAPLTRDQIDAIWSSMGSFTDRESDYRIFARAIEAAHDIKEGK
jgi:hypothetical protein